MSKLCEACGQETLFRQIGGRIVPLGCRCPRESASTIAESGDTTFKTTCPICGTKQVYFIRHNGGCVWVDALGDPWPKHPCFVDTEDGVEKFFPGQRVSCLGTVRPATRRDWLSRPVFYASCTAFSGFVLLLSSEGPLPTAGSLIALSEQCTVLHSEGGGTHRISTEVRRCQHCDEFYLWAEYGAHIHACMNKDFIACPVCHERFHWTQYGAHRTTHRST